MAGSDCNPSAWTGHRETCGDCAALVGVRDNGGVCEAFCELQGLGCVQSWDDETQNECSPGATRRSCDYNFGSTSDAICECASFFSGSCAAASCPDDSTGNDVPTGCTCDAGFSGTITATSSSPFYSGTCAAESCPSDSTGTDLPTGCTCDAGFSGTVTATDSSPHYSGSCTAVSCRAGSTGTDVPSGCSCDSGTPYGTIAATSSHPCVSSAVSRVAHLIATQPFQSHHVKRPGARIVLTGSTLAGAPRRTARATAHRPPAPPARPGRCVSLPHRVECRCA